MNIYVIGDSCIDRYIYGSCSRMCPEGPVPVFNTIEQTTTLGMAGNTYRNITTFFPDACFISNNPKTITKTRFVDKKTNQLLLRVDTDDFTNRVSNNKIEQVVDNSTADDLIVVSDYCKGFLEEKDLVTLGNSKRRISILDTKRLLKQSVIDAFDFIKLNEIEYKKNEDIFNKKNNADKLILTLGSRGVRFAAVNYKPHKLLQTFDVSGAGDVFTATFASHLHKTDSIEDSINFAQQCCIQVIQKQGTCVYEDRKTSRTNKS